MILFDISNTSIEVVQFSKSFWVGESVNSFAREEIERGLVKNGEIQNAAKLVEVIGNLLKNSKPKAMKVGECGFTLPDKRVYTHRFLPPQYSDGQAGLEPLKAQAERLVPQPLEQLARFTVPVTSAEENFILWVAAPIEIVRSYEEVFAELGFAPKLAVPESHAIYTLLAPTLQRGETVIYLDVGKRISTAAFMDEAGVVGTFSEPVQTAKLLSQIGKLLEFGRERLGKEVGRIILGGGGSLKIDPKEATRKLDLDITMLDTILEEVKLSIRTDFGGLPRVLFANVLGLAALSRKEEPLNLLKAV